MREEIGEAEERQALEFKNLIFAHDVVKQNPGIFHELYPQDAGLSPEDEEELEYVVPETMGEAERMLADLRGTGWG